MPSLPLQQSIFKQKYFVGTVLPSCRANKQEEEGNRRRSGFSSSLDVFSLFLGRQ
jgi:hypothetical protein